MSTNFPSSICGVSKERSERITNPRGGVDLYNPLFEDINGRIYEAGLSLISIERSTKDEELLKALDVVRNALYAIGEDATQIAQLVEART